jgi:hypothetical protein
MLTLPPQNSAVVRDPAAGTAIVTPTAGSTSHPSDGVQASQSRCDHLVGPAQSLCYAALYGVYV